jgi:hypothetical protein
MAQVTMRICDAHQQRGQEVPGIARQVSIDGFQATADLCEECYESNVVPLVTFLQGLGVSKPAKPRARSAARTRGRSRRPRLDNAAVRAWAKENRLDVAARGRVRQDVIEQYRAAHA